MVAKESFAMCSPLPGSLSRRSFVLPLVRKARFPELGSAPSADFSFTRACLCENLCGSSGNFLVLHSSHVFWLESSILRKSGQIKVLWLKHAYWVMSIVQALVQRWMKRQALRLGWWLGTVLKPQRVAKGRGCLLSLWLKSSSLERFLRGSDQNWNW